MEIALNRVAKTIIRRALNEDLGKRGDITSHATIPTNLRGEAVIIAKAAGVIAGQQVAAGVFEMLEHRQRGRPRPPLVKYEATVPDGTPVNPGEEVARISGKVWVILAAERTALNILQRCSGIATLTRQFVEAVAGTNAKISETRKTAPGLRYLDKAAVRVGGGVNHRYALHDAFLIKENHIAAVGSITKAIAACREFARQHGRFRVMVEARNFAEFEEALAAAPDRILLDNMPPVEIRACVARKTGEIELEASGGITLDNIRQYAAAGPDFISVGALTHSVKALDLSLKLI